MWLYSDFMLISQNRSREVNKHVLHMLWVVLACIYNQQYGLYDNSGFITFVSATFGKLPNISNLQSFGSEISFMAVTRFLCCSGSASLV